MADETEDTASPPVKALREEVGYLTNIFFVLGNGNIKANEAEYACKLLRYADGLLKEKTAALDSLIASEMLGREVKVEGSVLSVVPDKATH